MAKFFYNNENNGSRTYIKNIDFAEGKLTFTDEKDEAYEGRDGYYSDALRDQISTLFSSDYPQVKKLEVIDY